MSDLPITGEAATVAVSPGNTWADTAGMVASIGCAIHCATMPLVLAYLPMLGLDWLAGEGFHQWMAMLCFGLAAAAFVPGWRKHRSFLPAIWGIAGVALLTTAAFGMEGSCCPSCVESSNVAIGSTCSDETCTLCTATEHATESQSEPSSLLTGLAPFVTPLGGMLLVVGHVVNHRKSCTCPGNQCCLSTDETQS